MKKTTQRGVPLKSILFQVPEETAQRFQAKCREQDLTMSQSLRRFVSDYIKE